ncbi:glutathione S-transferase family protein [Paracoccus marinaquae]|uniref:Glutathione S-transferase family protein n=1 Tax=Paracoccus marinaquae TaxID=2841926 RepID=A0ABS6ALN5_9RHOB|nr:glutathione S-transferase family protein [Paracoccus marinaquae]MBU3030802.1 glutathione S-transferase family protein [Paracoccus marinaquae]
MTRDPIILTTYDWVPDFPRGHVRDIRIRWLLEEIDRPYRIETVPLQKKTPEHLARQPFHQVPMIRDGELSLFESGAILLYLAEGTDLMPGGDDRMRTIQWLIAALNSVEFYSAAWLVGKFFHKNEQSAAEFGKIAQDKLAHLQDVLKGRDWLVAGRFTVADLLMADILRLPAQHGLLDGLPDLRAYHDRALSRPAFQKALADQIAHFRAADAAMAQASA